MMQKNLEAGFSPRLALFATAALLALAAMIAAGAIASAQSTGNSGISPVTISDGDDDNPPAGGDGASGSAADSPECLQYSGGLADLQNTYFARLPSSSKDGSDRRLAAIPQADRLTEQARQCAQSYQSEAYPGLSWSEHVTCRVHLIESLRHTGAREERQDGTYAQFQRTATHSCRHVQTPRMDDDSTPPVDLIPPSEPRTEITGPHVAYFWICWEDCA